MIGIVILLVGSAVIYASHHGYLTSQNIIVVLRSYPAAAPLIFVTAYALLVMCLAPTFPLNLAAGFLWGPYSGWAYTMIGAMLGASGAFLTARYVARDYLNSKFDHRAWRWLQNEIEVSGWKAVAFARINPVFPFGPVNFFFGTTAVSFRSYFTSTGVFISIPALAVSYLGDSLGAFTNTGEPSELLEGIFLASVAISVAVAVRYAMKKTMRKR